MKIGICFEQWVKRRFLGFLERWLAKVPVSPETLDRKKIKRIIIIRQHDQLGDLLLSTPVFRALKTNLPGVKITTVVRSYTQELMAHHPYIDEVLIFWEDLKDWSLKKWFHFWRVLRSGYDLTVVLNTVSHSLSSDLMAFLTRSPYILGPNHLIFPGCKHNFIYNLCSHHHEGPKHQTERNLDIIRYIGIEPNYKEEEIGIREDEIRDAERYLSRGNDRRMIRIGIHPGAGKLENRWPGHAFSHAADLLLEQGDIELFLLQGPMEHRLAEEIRDSMRHQCTILAPMQLRELAAVVSCLDLFLCNDTGVMHVAASVGTTLIALFGPTDPVEWKPIGERYIALKAEDGKIDSISPEAVVSAAQKLLASTGVK